MKTKVLFIIESLVVGGAEHVLINLVNNLDQEKFDITVLSVYKESVYAHYKETFDNPFHKGIKYKWICDNSCVWRTKLFNYLLARIPTLLYRWFIGHHYDTEVAFYEGLPTRLISYSPYKTKKIAWLHTDVSLSQKQREDKFVIKEYSRYDKIIAVSKDVRNSFVSKYGYSDKTEVIHNPINEIRIREKAAEKISLPHETVPVFISVGRLCSVKGFDRLIRVANHLKQDKLEFKLWIVGEGEERSRLQSLIDEFDLTDYVTLWGNQQNPYPYMKAADWYVCSSRMEGYSTSIAESLIIGTPVVSVQCPGMEELLGENGEYGILTENSEEGVCRILSSLLNTPSIKAVYEQRTMKRNKSFNMERQISSINKLLRG